MVVTPSGRWPMQSLYSVGSRALAFAIKELKLKKPRKNAKYITGIYKGNYIRKQIKAPKVAEPVVPKLPQAGPVMTPKPFKNVHPPASTGKHGEFRSKSASDYFSTMKAWLKQNGPVLILNCGSVCTLIGFTRQDVLELRALSMTGSLGFVTYQLFQRPIRWVPIMWSALFSTVNAFKITSILFERTATVSFNDEEENIFVEHFMQHGVTPKQFENLIKKSKRMKFKAGEVIVQQGEPLEMVYLVINGATRAHRGGRHLSIVSSSPVNREKKIAGDSGAWAGEISFLDWLWKMEQAKQNDAKTGKKNEPSIAISKVAMYSIVAKEKCEVLEWSYGDLQSLLDASTDMRAAMTRAMTAAIANKVVNYTVSRSANNKSWSTWLSDWKNSGASSVNIVPSNDFG